MSPSSGSGSITPITPGPPFPGAAHARNLQRTWLSIDRYAQIMGLHPAHLNGVYSTYFPDTTCSALWFEHAWQSGGKLSREDLSNAIHDAEHTIAEYVGYNLLPDWTADERQQTVRPYRRDLIDAYGMNARGFMKSTKSRWAHAISGGIRAKTLIEASATIGRSDVDGDGYSETATITVTTTVAANEIHVYFPGENGADEWEVRPVNVSKSGNTATITFKIWQVPDQDLWEGMNVGTLSPTGIDGDTPANFNTIVDVYRVYNDPQQQVYFLWAEPDCSTCGGSGCTACEQGTQTGCLTVRDRRNGLWSYHPATWDATNSHFDAEDWVECREPDNLRLWYYSGWQWDLSSFPYSVLDPYWERAIAYYATALLARPLCECDCHAGVSMHWQDDLALQNTTRTYQNATRVLENPFGSTRGALYAWNAANADTRKIMR